VACVAFDLPYLPLRFSNRMIVCSSAETEWIPLSPLVGIPVLANGLSTSAFSSRSKIEKTNATNATHASKPYAVRLSGCGVCPSKRHTCHPKRHTQTQNATLVLRNIVATPLPQCPLAGIRSASASEWRDSPAAAPEACCPANPGLHRLSRTRNRDPIGGIPVMAAMVAADARRRRELLVLA